MQEKINILVAEDDLQLGFIIKDNLNDAGFNVIQYGQIAIDSQFVFVNIGIDILRSQRRWKVFPALK